MALFEGFIELKETVGIEVLETVLEKLGGPAGSTCYVPSVDAFKKHMEGLNRNTQMRERFEMVMREESHNGRGYTARAYRTIACEFGISERQVIRIVNGQ